MSRSVLALFGAAPTQGTIEVSGYFETIDDGGQRVAIRQVVVDASGVVHRYWLARLEDEVGFLTDQPVDYLDQLDEIPAGELARLWTSQCPVTVSVRL